MEPRAVELRVTLDGATRRKDKSISIRLVTALEGTTELMTWLDKRMGAELTALLAESDGPEVATMDGPPPKPSRKGSPSDRLYRTLWDVWMGWREERGEGAMPFEQAYPTWMEKIRTKIENGEIEIT